MVAPTSTKLFHLRMDIESGEAQQDGVLVFDDIPVGATVHARVDRPTELIEESDLHAAVAEVVSSGGRMLTWADTNPDTITASAGDFLADGFRPGMRVAVDSPLNPGVFLIADVTALVITLDVNESLTAEGPLSGGETLNAVPGVVQPYTFELAPPPASFTAGGVTFGRDAFGSVPPYVPSAANPSSRQRVLVTDGTGAMTPTQNEPAWAAFSPAVVGSLVQKGKAIHQMLMPGQAGLTPELAPEDRNFLRMRWRGTPQGTTALVSGMGAALVAQSPTWALGHRNLVPGSIALVLPTSGGPLRDNGKGRLVGPGGDGVVDYLTGAFSVNFTAAQTGDLDVTYEHDCGFKPLDVTLTFDPLQAQ